MIEGIIEKITNADENGFWLKVWVPFREPNKIENIHLGWCHINYFDINLKNKERKEPRYDFDIIATNIE